MAENTIYGSILPLMNTILQKFNNVLFLAFPLYVLLQTFPLEILFVVFNAPRSYKNLENDDNSILACAVCCLLNKPSRHFIRSIYVSSYCYVFIQKMIL